MTTENRLASYTSTLEVCKRDESIAHRTGATAAGDLIAALVAYVKAQGCRTVTISQLWDYAQAGYVWP